MKLRHLVPFGLAEPDKPRHYTDMAKSVWENRRALPYALIHIALAIAYLLLFF